MEALFGIGIAIGLVALASASWLLIHHSNAMHHASWGAHPLSGKGGILPFGPGMTFTMPPPARGAFERDDRSIAQMVVDLMVTWSTLYNADERDDATEVRNEIRRLGRELFHSGGHARMLNVAAIAEKLGRDRGLRSQDFEYHWDGIGDWIY